MANPQVYKLKEELSIVVAGEGLVIIKNEEDTTWLTSNEILNRMSPKTKNDLKAIASEYTEGAASSEASYVGSVLGTLARNGVIKQGKKLCPILGRESNCFAW